MFTYHLVVMKLMREGSGGGSNLVGLRVKSAELDSTSTAADPSS